MEVYDKAARDRPRARHHPGRHQARVRPATGRHHDPRRRGPHPRQLPLLARGRVAARPRPVVVRQADRARLAHRRVRLGPHVRRGAAAAARGRRRAHPRALRRGLRAADRGDVLTHAALHRDRRAAALGGAGLRLPRRPASPPRVAVEPAVGRRARGRGAPPRADLDRADRGRRTPAAWRSSSSCRSGRGPSAARGAGSRRRCGCASPTPATAVACVADGEVSGAGVYAVAAGSSGLLAGRAIAADLRTAGHRIAQRAERRVTAVTTAE